MSFHSVKESLCNRTKWRRKKFPLRAVPCSFVNVKSVCSTPFCNFSEIVRLSFSEQQRENKTSFTTIISAFYMFCFRDDSGSNAVVTVDGRSNFQSLRQRWEEDEREREWMNIKGSNFLMKKEYRFPWNSVVEGEETWKIFFAGSLRHFFPFLLLKHELRREFIGQWRSECWPRFGEIWRVDCLNCSDSLRTLLLFFGVSCERLWNFNLHCRYEIFHRVSRISHQIHPHWISNSIFHLAFKIPFKRQDISSSLHTAPSEQDKASILTNDKR